MIGLQTEDFERVGSSRGKDAGPTSLYIGPFALRTFEPNADTLPLALEDAERADGGADEPR